MDLRAAEREAQTIPIPQAFVLERAFVQAKRKTVVSS